MKRQHDIKYLNPEFAKKITTLMYRCREAYFNGETKTYFRVFETYRSPVRQQELFDAHNGSTKAEAWYSAHQYGLAADLVPYNLNTNEWEWSENHDYGFLKAEAELLDLEVPIKWDKCHVQSKKWKEIRNIALK